METQIHQSFQGAFPDALRKATNSAQSSRGHAIASLPSLILAMQEERTLPRKERTLTLQVLGGCADTTTSVSYGVRAGKQIYQVMHAMGPLKNADCLDNHLAVERSGKLYDCEGMLNRNWVLSATPNVWWWRSLGKNASKTAAQMVGSLSELRTLNTSAYADPVVTSLQIPDGYRLIPLSADIADVRRANDAGELTIFESGKLTREQFELDDRVLAVCGSKELVEIAGDVLFDQRLREAFFYDSVGSEHHLGDKEIFGSTPKVFPVGIAYDNYGICEDSVVNRGMFYVLPNSLKNN